MSVHISSRVWRMEMGSATRKLVMLKLADNANDEGYCYPSLSNIARECEINQRTARRIVRALEQAGFLKTEVRQRNGARTSNGYQIHLPVEGGGNVPPPPGQPAPTPGALCPQGGGTAPPRTTIPTVNEPPIQPVPHRHSREHGLYFRRDLDERLRLAAKLAVAELPEQLAQQVVDEWTARLLGRSIRFPERYLKTLVQRARAGSFVAVQAETERRRREASRSGPVVSVAGAGAEDVIGTLTQKWRDTG